MKEDIWAGLKNAMERGTPLEKAVESFINAGYNPREVNEAAKALSEGVTTITSDEKAKIENKNLTPTKQTENQQLGERRSLEVNGRNLPSVELQTTQPKEERLSDLKNANEKGKTLYVPGSGETSGQIQAYPSNQQFKNPEYLPNNGRNSSRKTKILILVLILLILICIGILGWIFKLEITEFVKEFYS